MIKVLILLSVLNAENEVLITNQGAFQDTLYIPEDYYSLSFSANKQEIFLKPGFDLKIKIMASDSLIYSGIGAVENEFLVQKAIAYENFGDFHSGMDYFKREENSFLHLMDSLEGILIQLLAKNQDKMDTNFFFYESKTAEFEKLNKIGNYEVFHGFVTRKDDFQVSDSFPDPFADIDLEDERQLKAKYYLSYVDTYFRTKAHNAGKQDYILTYVSTIKNEVQNPKIAEKFAYEIGINDLNYTDELEVVYAILKELINDQNKIAEVDKLYQKLNKVQKGNPSPDLAMRDADGKLVHLEEFKGKLVYIDFWATWCQPCLAEMPHLKETEEHFKEEDIVFISVCFRDSEENWRAMLAEKEMVGIQLFNADDRHEFVKAYDISGIPHFILIDQESNIIDPRATRPSDPELIPLIESYL